MYSLMKDTHQLLCTINDVSASWSSQRFRSRSKRIVKVVCTVILVLHGPLANAESETANLRISATVIRGCGISPNPVAFRNSDAETTHEISEIGIGKSLKINCGTGSAGTMAVSVGANIAGNASIRVISNDNGRAETLKEVYLTDEGTSFAAKHINLGLFPTAGQKVISIQTDNLIGSHVTTGSDKRTIILFVNF
jgi:spore coat protein U-like protein